MTEEVKILREQSEIEGASMASLVATFNAMTGKSIKKFESLAVARVRVSNAILSAQDRTAHAGVPKGAKPEAKTVDELPLTKDEKAAANNEDAGDAGKPDAAPDQQKEEDTMSEHDKIRAKRYPKAHAAEQARKAKAAAKKSGKAPAAKKAPAKKAPAAKKAATKKAAAAAPRQNVYEKVKLTQPDTLRRPQEGSQRSKVLDALKKRKQASIDQLSDDVGFNARPYVHKLVFQGWAEVVASKS